MTLVEVLAALLLIAVIGLIVLSLTIGSIQVKAVSEQKSEALQVAAAITDAYRKASNTDLQEEFDRASTADCSDRLPDIPNSGPWHLPTRGTDTLPEDILNRYKVCVKLQKDDSLSLFRLWIYVQAPQASMTYDALVGGGQ
ncbi:MAG: hypothetical protein IMW86_08130 [Hydrogenibacillus sp.]|nr:hypothetical protein [Hydrogenibacillus sp.]